MIAIYNPHKSEVYGRTFFGRLVGARYPAKYSYITELIAAGEVSVIVDEYGCSLPFRRINGTKVGLLLSKFEFLMWTRINGLTRSSVRILSSSTLLGAEDALFVFAFEHLQRYPCPTWNPPPPDVRCVVHLSHYFFRTWEIAANIREIKSATLMSEVDLSTSSLFFRTYFGPASPGLVVVPFAVQERFENRVPLRDRDMRAIAVGSFLTFVRAAQTEAMADFYQSDTIHPLRKEIWERREEIGENIHVQIGYINEFVNKAKTNAANRIGGRISSIGDFLTRKFLRNYGRSPHYQIDIVDSYNRFQMVVSPEESGELPSISTFEAMACGCAVLCSADVAYSSIGMKPDVHYIEYNGSLDDLQMKIRYYQRNQDELSRIALAGEAFAREHFNLTTVKRRFVSCVAGTNM